MSDKSDVPDKPDKLDKFLAGGDITLSCLIPGEGRNIFDVTISNANNNRVSSLAEAIRTRRLDRFQDIDPTSLALYKVGFISDSVVIHNLSNNEYFEVEGVERMEPQDTIFSHLPTQPQRIYSGEKGINIIMYLLTEMGPEILRIDNYRSLFICITIAPNVTHFLSEPNNHI